MVLMSMTHPLWAQPLDQEIEPIPGVLYVAFSGLPAFGQTGLSLGEISSAFPEVDHLAAKRSLPMEVLRLQSIYRVSYSDPIPPRKAAARVGRVPGVMYAEPIYPPLIDELPMPDDPLFAPGGNEASYQNRLKLVEA